MSAQTNQSTIVLLRVLHGLIALMMIASVAVVYRSAASHTYNIWLFVATAALLIEGAAVALNGGDCPLSYLSRRHGDRKAFFELLLPKRAAKQMFKVNVAAIAVGYLFLLVSFVV
jgi:hypothetical protein